jgi:RND family efflux transporter MFP subunit
MPDLPIPEPATAQEPRSPLRDASQPPAVPALRPAPAARTRRRWGWIVAGLLALALALGGAARVWMARPLPVAVESVTPAPVTRVLAVNGRMEAVHSVEVRPTVSGPVAALPVAEGAVVPAGTVLARIDAEAQNALVRQAVAGLDAALIAQTEARESHARALALGGNIARSIVETRARALQSAGQEVARLTALLEQAQIALRDHTIRAPIAGTVLALDAEVGQIADPGRPLLTLADMDDLVVEADVDEAYATQIAPGQAAVLQLAGEAGTRAGHVDYVSRQVDVATGGLDVRIAFDGPVAAPVGLTVAANIIVARRAAALTVPRTALHSAGDRTGVYVVEEGVARFRPVTVVDWPAARLVVTAGLAEGAVVITDAAGIAEGQPVTAARP